MALPEHLEAERKALIQEIHAAFAGVSREGGVSWSESIVIDDWGDAEACATARKRDTDRSWTELVDGMTWDYSIPWGGYSFLDPIGARYYLPAAMCRILREIASVSTRKPDTEADGDGAQRLLALLEVRAASRRDHSFRLLTLLDHRQRLATARFVRLMMSISELSDTNDTFLAFTCDNWSAAHEAYWHLFR